MKIALLSVLFFSFSALSKDCDCRLKATKANGKTVNSILFSDSLPKAGTCKNVCTTYFNTKNSSLVSAAKSKGFCGEVVVATEYKKDNKGSYKVAKSVGVNLNNEKVEYVCSYGGKESGSRCIFEAPSGAKVKVSGNKCTYQGCPSGAYVDGQGKCTKPYSSAKLPSDIKDVNLGKYYIYKGSLYEVLGSPSTNALHSGTIPSDLKLMVIGGDDNRCSYLRQKIVSCPGSGSRGTSTGTMTSPTMPKGPSRGLVPR